MNKAPVLLHDLFTGKLKEVVMMPPIRIFALRLLSIFALLLLVSLTGCGSSKLCCQDLENETEEKVYCRQHQSAVRKFVNSTLDDQQKRQRLEDFREFYDDIKYCNSIKCLESMIFSAPQFKAFSQLYALEHEVAEINTSLINNQKKTELVLCGFRTAIEQIDKNLISRGY